MKPTHTGIAVALGLAVIAVFFIFPGLSPFGNLTQSNEAVDSATNTETTSTMSDALQLQVTDEIVGTGASAAAGDTVTVNYVGSLTNGTVFDASANHGSEGFTFTLGAGQVIKGWDEGLIGMQAGGTRKLIIPAAFAYGDQAVGNVIPANSTLIFDVELVKVQKPAQ